jgi:hypothetical protein
MAREIVYFNNGEVYKEQSYFSNTDFDPEDKFNYVPVSNNDPIAPFVKHQDGKVKTYTSTKEARKWNTNVDSGESLSGYNLCPGVTLWWGKGVIDNENYDLYFRVDNPEVLKQVASYYSLPYPINDEIETELSTPENISMYTSYSGQYLVLGAIKFINNNPAILKMYCFYKDKNNSVITQKGRSLYNKGQVFEQGTLSHTSPSSFATVESTAIGQSIEYKAKRGDPLFNWEALITKDGVTKIKNYESSKQYRTLIAHLTTGNDYSDYDLCPSVNIWVGRSWIDGGEEELYFYLENSSMLESVATYYSLPEPCTSDTKSKIDSNPEDFRLRHQDINQIGSRSVPVVIASIVFEDDVATMFKLYEITRWNE